MTQTLSERWEAAPSDPRPNTDLDYELRVLTVIELDECPGGEYMILPGEEEHLFDEEFIIADSVCRLSECR